MNRSLLAAMFVCAGCAFAASAQPNSGVRLTDGDATLDYAHNSFLPTVSFGSAGVPAMNFQVEGAPGTPTNNQLPQGNWFYRFDGDNRERQLANANIRTLNGTNSVDYWFNNVFTGGAANIKVPDTRAHMDFNIYDTGFRKARMTTHLCFENNGNTTISGQIFFVADIDLDNTVLNDNYQMVDSSVGKKWTLTDGFATARMFAPGAIGAGVDNYNNLLLPLLTGGPNSLVPDMNPGGLAGFDDWVAGVQIPFMVAPHSMNCYGVEIEIDMELAPSPGALPLIAFGGLVATRRRRA